MATHFTPGPGLANPNGVVTVQTDPNGGAISVTPDGGAAAVATLTANAAGLVSPFATAQDYRVLYLSSAAGVRTLDGDERAASSGRHVPFRVAAATAGTLIRAGQGRLDRVVIGTAGDATARVTVHDAATVAGISAATQLQVLDASAARAIELGDDFNLGLVVVVAGTTIPDISVVHN